MMNVVKSKVEGIRVLNQDTIVTNIDAYYKGSRTLSVAGNTHTHR